MKKNYWKLIILALFSSILIFHFAALWYIRGENYQLTSKDYYAREGGIDQRMAQLRAGEAYNWSYEFLENGGFSLKVSDAQGNLIALDQADIQLYRPNQADADIQTALSPAEEFGYQAALPKLASGRWDLTITARSGDQELAHFKKLSL